MSTRPSGVRARLVRAALAIVAVVMGVVALGNLAHRVIWPLPAPDPQTFPRPGDRLVSRSEGFTQTIEAIGADGRVASELVLAPGAVGPPKHFHEGFTEVFEVREGTLVLELGDAERHIGPGETVSIPPGVPHRPHNPGATPVVVTGSSIMPLTFAACLPQLYAIVDGAPAAEGRAMPLQLAVQDAICDTHLAELPRPVSRAMVVVLGPVARALGYRNYYPELSLHPQG
jgi:mannose-6-phosphate isomerase-like protein (cupin superfamily)